MQKGRVLLIPIVALLFCLSSALSSIGAEVTTRWIKNNLENKRIATSIPIWMITQDGTAISVSWVDYAPNPRFAIYDMGNEDDTDDLVLDKETGLVWERSPNNLQETWYSAADACYYCDKGGRSGWRTPAIEELLSLADVLAAGNHPFPNLSEYYWSKTTCNGNSAYAYKLQSNGIPISDNKTYEFDHYWCVRGGRGLDGY